MCPPFDIVSSSYQRLRATLCSKQSPKATIALVVLRNREQQRCNRRWKWRNCLVHLGQEMQRVAPNPRPLLRPLRQGWQNSTWPTLPYRERGQCTYLYQSESEDSGRNFSGSSYLTLARLLIVNVASNATIHACFSVVSNIILQCPYQCSNHRIRFNTFFRMECGERFDLRRCCLGCFISSRVPSNFAAREWYFCKLSREVAKNKTPITMKAKSSPPPAQSRTVTCLAM